MPKVPSSELILMIVLHLQSFFALIFIKFAFGIDIARWGERQDKLFP